MALGLCLLLVCGTTARAAFALYVSNAGNNTILKFDASGNATLFATNGVNGVLSNPTGLAMDSLGNLYVANYGFVSNLTNTVVVYDPLGHGSPFAYPSQSQGAVDYSGMAFDSAGNLIIANRGGQRIIEVANGTHAAAILYDYNPSELFGPFSVAFDSAGNLYVANAGNNWIERFAYPTTNATQFITNFASPTGMAFDSAGNLYVPGPSGDIWKFDAQGQNKTRFASAFTNGMSAPYGLAFDGAGNLYVADNSISKIFKFPPGGGIGTVFATASKGLSSPWFIVIQDSQADLAVSKTVDLTNAYVGATVTFSITVTNPGPSAASPVVVAEQLVTAGLSYVGFNNLYANSSFDGTHWTITNLPAGTAAQLQVMATLTATGMQTNTALIQSSGANDTNANNNAASATVMANPLPPIGGATYADSADFTLNTTGVSPIIGGASFADSGDFTLNTTGVSATAGGASYADSADFTLNTTGVSALAGGASYADSGDFTLNTTGLSALAGGASYADSPDFTLNTTGVSALAGGASFADSLDFTLNTGGIQPFSLTGSFKLAGGAFQFSFNNTPGLGFSVYGVTNPALPLSNWTFLGTLTENPPGQYQFADPQATNTPQRFYRVTSP